MYVKTFITVKELRKNLIIESRLQELHNKLNTQSVKDFGCTTIDQA